MVLPLKDFLSWFDIIGDYSVDPDSGKINVQGQAILARHATLMPYDFQKITGSLDLHAGRLQSLEGCPQEVTGTFGVGRFEGRDLVGGPQRVGGNYAIVYHNNLTSLRGLAEWIGGWLFLRYSPTLPLLRTLVAKQGVSFYHTVGDSQAKKAESILNRYKGQPEQRFSCQKDLEEAELGENAKW